ncbi:formin-like protein 5 [Herpailurus yagouaroundi]|uniref:formin-like protein 5 n=1 Tax=Herpailurus yagouaroundi TaxID=1608482 RepID=UPI001AD62E5B|nr:formin-like protein 5 [Puma yagouaroundi]
MAQSGPGPESQQDPSGRGPSPAARSTASLGTLGCPLKPPRRPARLPSLIPRCRERSLPPEQTTRPLHLKPQALGAAGETGLRGSPALPPASCPATRPVSTPRAGHPPVNPARRYLCGRLRPPAPRRVLRPSSARRLPAICGGFCLPVRPPCPPVPGRRPGPPPVRGKRPRPLPSWPPRCQRGGTGRDGARPASRSRVSPGGRCGFSCILNTHTHTHTHTHSRTRTHAEPPAPDNTHPFCRGAAPAKKAGSEQSCASAEAGPGLEPPPSPPPPSHGTPVRPGGSPDRAPLLATHGPGLSPRGAACRAPAAS